MQSKYEVICSTAYSTKETCESTLTLALYCLGRQIKGDFVETGVAAGCQIGLMKLSTILAGESKHIWGYDSFEGIPFGNKELDVSQPGIGDIQNTDNDDKLESSGITVHSLSNVIHNMIDVFEVGMDNVTLVPGWFQDTVKNHKEPISLLRLDGDLYSSTKVCLEYLFPLVSLGGVVIVDDYALPGCLLACNEYFKFIGYEPNYMSVPNSTPKYFYK